MMINTCLKNNAVVVQVMAIIDQANLFYQFSKLDAHNLDLMAARTALVTQILNLNSAVWKKVWTMQKSTLVIF